MSSIQYSVLPTTTKYRLHPPPPPQIPAAMSNWKMENCKQSIPFLYRLACFFSTALCCLSGRNEPSRFANSSVATSTNQFVVSGRRTYLRRDRRPRKGKSQPSIISRRDAFFVTTTIAALVNATVNRDVVASAGFAHSELISFTWGGRNLIILAFFTFLAKSHLDRQSVVG